jgi:gamma-glutamyltranspeptidase/glutathione hydrolase
MSAPARNGMVASAHPLASLAGVDVLRAGGTAMDAGIAMAAMLNVVDPAMTGIGGDLCLLYYSAREERLCGLNATGRAAREATRERYAGQATMPLYGPLTITVPGAVDGWASAVERYGRRSLGDLLAPAIETAEDGFPVGPALRAQWDTLGSKRLVADADAMRAYAPEGHFPGVGETLRLPDLARSLRLIADNGPDAFYRGALARAIVGSVRAKGGLLALDDLAQHRSEWVAPIARPFRGVDVHVLPPSTQGVALLQQLGILDEVDLPALGMDTGALMHVEVEAARLALHDLDTHVSDPDFAPVDVAALLDARHLASLRARIAPGRRIPLPPRQLQPQSHTTCVAVADGEGNALVLLNSLRNPFGSGIVAGDTGILLQNRGRDFSLDPTHANCIAPGKRTMHTLCPVMVMEAGEPRLAIGTVGAHKQTQGTQQVLVSHLVFGLGLQASIEAPRWVLSEDNEALHVEPAVTAAARGALVAAGHDVVIGRTSFGGTQAVAIDARTGTFTGGSDTRYDGTALGY